MNHHHHHHHHHHHCWCNTLHWYHASWFQMQCFGLVFVVKGRETWLKSGLWQRLSWMWFFSVPPGKEWDSSSN
jgi:hypothetical protein